MCAREIGVGAELARAMRLLPAHTLGVGACPVLSSCASSKRRELNDPRYLRPAAPMDPASSFTSELCTVTTALGDDATCARDRGVPHPSIS
jgi:hypothetical protein